jgi:hypothetical protein
VEGLYHSKIEMLNYQKTLNYNDLHGLIIQV